MYSYLQHLGRFCERLAKGSVLVPDPENPLFAKWVDVEPPEIVVREVTRSQRLLDEAFKHAAANK